MAKKPKYDHGNTEKEILEWWKHHADPSFKPTGDKEIFSIDTPPPYISGFLHPGHAMGYIQLDCIARYQRMSGKDIFFPFGYDNNGLPTERMIEKKYGKDIKQDRKKFRQLCIEATEEMIINYRNTFLRLGISADFDNAYTTISDEAQCFAQRSFIDLYNNDQLTRREESTDWCPQCNTAIAQSEIESQNEHHPGTHDRCGATIEKRAAKMWFIHLDNHSAWQARGEELNWYPEKNTKSKYLQWIANIDRDWCISRQRSYGIPIPTWYCQDCSATLLADEKDIPVDPTTESFSGGKCPHCGSANIEPEMDILDTWMTSSLTALINARWGEDSQEEWFDWIYPMTLRPQGHDIINNWLFYSIVKSHYHTDSLPWENVMITGMGTDDKGEKFSKSKGNAPELGRIINQYSADAIRYWATGGSLGANRRFSETEMRTGSKTIIKILNASKFSGQFSETIESTDKALEYIEDDDRKLLNKLQDTIREYHDSFAEYDYCKAREVLDKLFWDEFCSKYIEQSKDRLWGKSGDSSREAAAYCLKECLSAILRMYAPFLPFITEKLWQDLYTDTNNPESIHTQSTPHADDAIFSKLQTA
jgi:valyl-tRNA synthetase